MNFFDKVYIVTKAIPYGQVATYGQIAAAIGQARAARAVGMALARCNDQHIPWHRVINRHGMISIENMTVSKEVQASLLRQEGVAVDLIDNNYFVNLANYIVDNTLLYDSLAKTN